MPFDKVKKFGYIPDIDAGETNQDVWFDGEYSFLSAAQALSVASASANDAAAGSGISEVNVYALDANYHESLTTKTLTGQTEVALGTFLRTYRAYVGIGTGTGTTNAGNIWVGYGTFTAGVPANKQAVIYAGLGQSTMGIYTVPMRGANLHDYHAAYITRWYGTIGGGVTAAAVIALQTREFGGAWRTKRIANIGQNGPFTENIISNVDNNASGLNIPPKTDIRIRVLSNVLINSTISAGFDIDLEF